MDENSAEKHGQRAQPHCPACLTPYSPSEQFCHKCGRPVGALATVGPFEQIRSVGYMYGAATSGSPRAIVLLGMWLILFPGAAMSLIGGIIIVAEHVRPYRDIPMGAILLLMGVAGGALLWRATFRYLTTRRASPTPAGTN
jgi:hypothetical protein